MASKTLSSPLVSAFNSISSIGESSKMASRLQSDFVSMINFIETQNAQLDAIELPDKKKIKQVSNINVASTFGSPGGLLSSLASGALDIAGFLGNFFPGRGKAGRPLPFRMPGSRFGPKIRSPKITPRGSKLRFGGVKGLGVLNALFTGLDFYQGLQEGESIGKAATGAGASLAGSIVGGILGSSLGPLGTFAGASLGGFVGGWLGDRAYETVTGWGQNTSKKLEERRKKQFESQKEQGGEGFAEVINKFNNSVNKFEKIVLSGKFGSVDQKGKSDGKELKDSDSIEPKKSIDTGNRPQETGQQMSDFEASGGEIPGKPDSAFRTAHRPRHNGNDYFKNVGTPISVIQPGVVTVANMNYNPGGWGALVEIKHSDGSLSRYAHLSRIMVKPGEKIEPGRVIGNTGGAYGAYGSGNSEGPHLHFEYLPSGSGQVDPTNAAKKIFRFGGNVKVKPSATSTQSLVPGTTSNIQGSSSEQKVMNYLMQQGLTKAQSAGIAGNLKQESRFNPNSDNGSHRGIAQWDKEERWPMVSKYIKSIGLDPNTLEGQLAGLVWEANKRGDLTKIKSETTSVGSAKSWLKNFERSGEVPGQSGYESRIRFAKQLEGINTNIQQAQVSSSPNIPQRVNQSANQIQYYPSYNRSQSSVVMMMPVDSGGSSRSVPTIPSRPSFSNGSTAANRSYSMEGEIVNSFAKIALLTNLSGS